MACSCANGAGRTTKSEHRNTERLIFTSPWYPTILRGANKALRPVEHQRRDGAIRLSPDWSAGRSSGRRNIPQPCFGCPPDGMERVRLLQFRQPITLAGLRGEEFGVGDFCISQCGKGFLLPPSTPYV